MDFRGKNYILIKKFICIHQNLAHDLSLQELALNKRMQKKRERETVCVRVCVCGAKKGERESFDEGNSGLWDFDAGH